MSKKLRIAFDLDCVFINIHDYDPPAEGKQGGWLWRHNRDYGHEKILSSGDLVEWNVSKFAAPSCGVKIFDYLSDPDFYDNAPPVEGAIETFWKIVNDGHEPWFVTSGVHKGKYDWVKRHGIATLMDGGVKAKNIITIDEKVFLAPLFDVLVDDRAETCRDWEEAGVTAILFDQPWNQWFESKYRAVGWQDVYKYIKELSGDKA